MVWFRGEDEINVETNDSPNSTEITEQRQLRDRSKISTPDWFGYFACTANTLPSSYEDASSCIESEKWKCAMEMS